MIFLLLTLLIAFYKHKAPKDIVDYAVSNKNFTTPVLVASIFATFVGAGSVSGFVEMITANGLIYCLIFLGSPISKLWTAKFVVPRMKKFIGCISAGDIVAKDYGKQGRIIIGIANFITSVGDIGIQLLAIGKISEIFFDIPIGIGAIIGYLFIIFYSSVSGIRSVTTTDVFQFIILIFSLPLMGNIILMETGGYIELFNSLPDFQKKISEDDLKIMLAIIPMLIIRCLPFEMPSIIQRILMSKNIKIASRSLFIASFIDMAFILLLVVIALGCSVLFPDIDSNNTLYFAVNKIMPSGLKGIVISGLIAVVMSTSDSVLNNASIALVHDVLKSFDHELTVKKELLYTRVLIVFIGGCALFITLNFSSVFEIWIKSYSIWVVTVVVPLIFQIFDIKSSLKGYLISCVLGLLSYIILTSVLKITTAEAILVSLLLNFFCFIFFCYKNKTISFADYKSGIQSLYNKLCEFFTEFSLFKKLKLSSVEKFSSSRVALYGAQYETFGVFALFNYLIPYFMWSEINLEEGLSLVFLRASGGILCSLLIIKNYWPNKLKKYLPVYWHITLTYCLSFITFYMFLESFGNIVWMINVLLSLFLLIILVDWLSFIFIILIGCVCAFLLHIYGSYEIEYSSVTSEFLYLFVYASLFSVLIGFIFSRNREFIQKKVVLMLEEKVQQRTKSLKDALNSKKEFLNNMSHEIRTPLQGIIGISDALVDQWEDLSAEEKFMYTKKVSESGNRMLKLVSDLLDMSKFDEGKMILNFTQSNIIKICEDVVEELHGLYIGKDIKVQVKIEKDLSGICRIDSFRIEQVLRNLISNAIKYSKNGLVEISIETYNDTKQEKFIEVNVSDQGVGIPTNQLKKVFQPFVQSTRTNKGAGGTGLGLSICQEIIFAHNGKIWCSNNKDQGTTFSFRVPVMNIKEKNKSKIKLNILVIDDDTICLSAAQLILKSNGHHVVLCSSATEGIETLFEGKIKFDLILLDLMMQDMYGLNALEKIKKNKDTSKIPVIIQSGMADASEVEKAIEMGAASNITKPYIKEKILEAIADVIKDK